MVYTGTAEALIDFSKVSQQLLKILNEQDHTNFEVTSSTDSSGKKVAIVNLKNQLRQIFIDWTDSENPIGYTETNADCTSGNTASGNASFAVALKKDPNGKYKPIHGKNMIPPPYNRNKQNVETEGDISVDENGIVSYGFFCVKVCPQYPPRNAEPSVKSRYPSQVEGVSQLVAYKSANTSGNPIKDYAIEMAKLIAQIAQGITDGPVASATTAAIVISPIYRIV